MVLLGVLVARFLVLVGRIQDRGWCSWESSWRDFFVFVGRIQDRRVVRVAMPNRSRIDCASSITAKSKVWTGRAVEGGEGEGGRNTPAEGAYLLFQPTERSGRQTLLNASASLAGASKTYDVGSHAAKINRGQAVRAITKLGQLQFRFASPADGDRCCTPRPTTDIARWRTNSATPGKYR